MKIEPIADRVLIEPEPAKEKTAGGIIIPDGAKERPVRGKIISVGPGRAPLKEMETKPGDIAIYTKHSGHEVEIDNKMYLLMKESDIFAVIR